MERSMEKLQGIKELINEAMYKTLENSNRESRCKMSWFCTAKDYDMVSAISSDFYEMQYGFLASGVQDD